MEKQEKIGTGDPYGAIAVWYFEANRDPEKFLRIFEGVAPDVEGMVWLGDGYICVGEDAPAELRLELPIQSDSELN